MLYDQVTDFAARACAAGVEVDVRVFPDMVHAWMTLAALTPQAEPAYQAVGPFVRRVAGRSAAAAAKS
jgi:acetyl esterase/lipase